MVIFQAHPRQGCGHLAEVDAVQPLVAVAQLVDDRRRLLRLPRRLLQRVVNSDVKLMNN
jgi:hypothetical protein